MDSSSQEPDPEATKALMEDAIRAKYAERGCGCNPDFVWSIPDMAYPHRQVVMIYHSDDCVIARTAQSKWN